MTKQELQARIEKAVSEGRKSRSAYYAEIALEDEQQFGDPATEDQLSELEARLHRPLPPSYRMFLSLHNGWRMASGAIDLLTVREMLSGPREASIHKWQSQARAVGDSLAADSLVIGYSEISSTKFLLDPTRIDAEGEWTVVGYDKMEEWTCPSFLTWLEESAREFQELFEEERANGSV
jgi:cell wall assembly regulator SMI1